MRNFTGLTKPGRQRAAKQIDIKQYADAGYQLRLGLAIAKQIVEIHGGTIAAENCPEGIKFIVMLPRVSPDGGDGGRKN